MASAPTYIVESPALYHDDRGWLRRCWPGLLDSTRLGHHRGKQTGNFFLPSAALEVSTQLLYRYSAYARSNKPCCLYIDKPTDDGEDGIYPKAKTPILPYFLNSEPLLLCNAHQMVNLMQPWRSSPWDTRMHILMMIDRKSIGEDRSSCIPPGRTSFLQASS